MALTPVQRRRQRLNQFLMLQAAAFASTKSQSLTSAATLLSTWADSNGGLAFDFTDINSGITGSTAYGSGKIIDGATPANNWSTTSSLTPFDKLTFTRASTAYYYNSSGVLTQAASGTARIDYNPSTLAVRGLLVEEARTNLYTYAEQLDNAAWTPSNSSVTANQSNGPYGTATLEFLKENSATGAHILIGPSITTSAATYTLSVYARAGTRTRFMVYGLNMDGKGRGFDLSSGTTFTVNGIADAGSYGMDNCGGGLYRCWITTVATATTTNSGAFYMVSGSDYSYAGDNTSGLYLGHAQFELGSFPTSYIPTTSASVTRAADAVSLATSAYNKSWPCSMFAEYLPTSGSGNGGILAEYSTGQIELYHNSGNKMVAFSNGTATGNKTSTGSITALSITKAAASFNTNDLAMSLNGAAIDADATVDVPNSARTTLYFGYDPGGGFYINGWLRKSMIVARDLPDASLITLAT